MNIEADPTNNYIIDISHKYDLKQLQQEWLSLQEKQDLPFFITWSWISCWIQTYDPSLIIVSAIYKGKTVAIGIFTRSEDKRHGFIKSRQYRLHQTGDQQHDQIWIEYNDFICDPEHQEYAVAACLNQLMHNERQCDEIILSMMKKTRALAIIKHFKNARLEDTTSAHLTNLSKLNGTKNTYISTLSSNTRYQIRKSTRLYEKEYGSLSLNFAQTAEQAIDYFYQAGELHKNRWHDSGFYNHSFTSFHETLIRKNFEKNQIDLVKVKAGSTILAIIYYHKTLKNIYFYLQGINYNDNKQLKPGLVSHALLTEHYASQQMKLYDYMGGFSQYKVQLSNETIELSTVVIHRNNWLFNLENQGRKIRNRLRS